MHLLPVIQEYQLQEFLESKGKTSGPRSYRWVEGKSLQTSCSLKETSTSDTSHHFPIRHNDPGRPDMVNRYDLNSTVYTTCANCINWSGVRAVSGMFRIARKFRAVASDSGDTAKGLYRMSSELHPASVVCPSDTNAVHRWTA